MFFTVYCITNTATNKRYIGCHKTTDLDDGYLGSGKVIKQSVAKHGSEAFIKHYLWVGSTSEEMFEREIHFIETLQPEYNIKPGGKGGFDYINDNGLWRKWQERRKLLMQDPVWRAAYTKKQAKSHREHWKTHTHSRLGTKHTDETKQNFTAARLGTVFVNNGKTNRRVSKPEAELLIQQGYRKGRLTWSSRDTS